MTRREHMFIKLMEECAEVQQIVSKILQFGEHSRWPALDDPTNLERLTNELNDLHATIQILEEQKLIPTCTAIEKHSHYQNRCIRFINFRGISEGLGFVDEA